MTRPEHAGDQAVARAAARVFGLTDQALDALRAADETARTVAATRRVVAARARDRAMATARAGYAAGTVSARQLTGDLAAATTRYHAALTAIAHTLDSELEYRRSQRHRVRQRRAHAEQMLAFTGRAQLVDRAQLAPEATADRTIETLIVAQDLAVERLSGQLTAAGDTAPDPGS